MLLGVDPFKILNETNDDVMMNRIYLLLTWH